MPREIAPTPTDARRTYVARINRVLDHIQRHLDGALDLQTLAGVAHFSPFHFHRVFQAMTGETLADCVRRMRLEAAAQRLLTQPPRPALDVALQVGFGSAAVFTRAFKAHFGVTPTVWRRGAWRDFFDTREAHLRKIHQAQRKPHQAAAPCFGDDLFTGHAGPQPASKGIDMQVQLKKLPAMRLAYMRHTGPYGSGGIGQVWKRFAAWCAAEGPMTSRQTTYGIGQDNPAITPPEKCRYDCCVAVAQEFKPGGEVGVQDFAGGQYACVPFKGSAADIHGAWMQLYGQWLPQSGWQADDKPGVEVYGTDYDMDEQSGVFNCELCVPVRPL